MSGRYILRKQLLLSGWLCVMQLAEAVCERKEEMRFLYIAPRYHTNQVPIMKGLLKAGHEVLFLSQYAGKIEDYSHVKPVIIGYSNVFRFLYYLYGKLSNAKPEKKADLSIKIGFPPPYVLFKQIKSFGPDIAILRERSVYTVFAYQICRLLKVPAILYNQSPLWEESIKNDVWHRLMRSLTPRGRMTPVLGTPGEGKVKEQGACFVPFVMEPSLTPKQKQNLKQSQKDSQIRIFCIGKYEKRKNHLMMIAAVDKLTEHYPLHLVIAGECTTAAHQEYYQEVEEDVRNRQLEAKVQLYRNLERTRVWEEYAKADLFVIPSTLEPASISQLEAMAFSLPVICSDTNGTACYVEEGANGYRFRDNHKEALIEAMERIIRDRDTVTAMGRVSYEMIVNNCSFSVYYQGITEMISRLGHV